MQDNIIEDIDMIVVHDSIRNIQDLTHLKKIETYMKQDLEPTKKIDKIFGLHSEDIVPTETKSKLISTFEAEQVVHIFDVFGYQVCREELILICAYTGGGKTTILLSLLKQAVHKGLNPLYISVADWSEKKLFDRIDSSSSDFPDFHVVCCSEITLGQIEVEIETLKPDVLFLDYLTVVIPPSDFEAHRLQLASIAKGLKRLAQEHNLLIITAHQLVNDVEYPTANDLSESKSLILAECDLVQGIGKTLYDNIKNVTDIKLRSHAPQGNRQINIDYVEFEVD